MRIANILTALFVALLLAGCPEKPAGGDHDHDHDHGEHGHSHGESVELGEITHDEVKLEVFKAGDWSKEGVLEVKVLAHADKIKALRAWVGAESGEGSVKAIGKRVKDAYDMHLELPAKMEGARVWVELETTSSKKVFPFDIKGGGDKDGHDDHGHGDEDK